MESTDSFFFQSGNIWNNGQKLNLKVSGRECVRGNLFGSPSIGRLFHSVNDYVTNVFAFACSDNNDSRVFSLLAQIHSKQPFRVAPMTFIETVICRYLSLLVSCTCFFLPLSLSRRSSMPDIHKLICFVHVFSLHPFFLHLLFLSGLR